MNGIETPPVEMGRFLVLDRQDWQEAADSEWSIQDKYLFNGNEQFVGEREIRGRTRKVYMCLNEEEHVAWFPDEIAIALTAEPDETPDFLRFEGKNWKLAGDRKWRPSNFARKRTHVGTRVIDGTERDVFKEDGFDSYVVIVV